MNLNRRKFVRNSLIGGIGAAAIPLVSSSIAVQAPDYAKLDEILKRPVFKRELFNAPVIIESVELLRLDKSQFFLCRVRSSDGAEGISVSHDMMSGLHGVFNVWVQEYFIGKDARDLDLIIEKVYDYRLNYRLSGTAVGVPVATLEFAILDMMGKIAGVPVGKLIGDIHHTEVPVYQATEYRDLPVEKSMELIIRDLEESQSKALKIKVGGQMFWTKDLHAKAPANRTEEIVPLIRKTFGDKLALYADSNGYYSVDEAIRVGGLLQENGFKYFEEPVRFYWYEETKQVADAVEIPIAGGEQEFTLHGFRWLIANKALQVLQPDNFYCGGMIRTMKVARMADALGLQCTPHITGGGLGYLYMLHFVSALPNAAAHHEFKGFRTSIEFTCNTSPLTVDNGKIQVPTGPGLGIEIDKGFIAKHKLVVS